jgi:hypothetical protein
MIRIIFNIIQFPAHIIDTIIYLIILCIKIGGSWWTLLGLGVSYFYIHTQRLCIDSYQYYDYCIIYNNITIWFAWLILAIKKRNFRNITPPTWWRLRKPKPKAPKAPKEIIAAIPIKSHAEAKQTRQAMTARLHPDLQAYLAKATKP